MMDPASFYAVVRRDFPAFNQKCFEILNPGASYEDNWHLLAIAAALIDMVTGGLLRLIINMPPRSLKSSTVSVAWVAFLLGLDPSTRIIVTSYSEVLAEKLSADTKRVMESAFYRATFPNTKLERSTKLLLETTAGGIRFATSVGGSVTGLGGEWIISDDPHNATEAYSAPAREGVKRYFDQTLSSRLDDEATGKIILVMQRLHADDLAGHLLSQGGWRQLKLQAQATEDATVEIGGGRLHHIKAGDLMHPRRLPLHVLQDKQRQMGSANYQAQHQQEPVPATGNMVKREWLCYYDLPPSSDGGRITLSLDTATKTNPANDYSVCTVFLEKDGRHYLLGLWRDKVDYPALKRKIIELFQIWRATNLLIEDQGAGSSLIQELTGLGVPAVPCKARDSKEARLSAASSYIEAGLMWLPKDAPWLAEFETELLGFPGARYDDQVDSVSQYFGWARDKPRGFFSYEFMY